MAIFVAVEKTIMKMFRDATLKDDVFSLCFSQYFIMSWKKEIKSIHWC